MITSKVIPGGNIRAAHGVAEGRRVAAGLSSKIYAFMQETNYAINVEAAPRLSRGLEDTTDAIGP
jgi:hypothetical protein